MCKEELSKKITDLAVKLFNFDYQYGDYYSLMDQMETGEEFDEFYLRKIEEYSLDIKNDPDSIIDWYKDYLNDDEEYNKQINDIINSVTECKNIFYHNK